MRQLGPRLRQRPRQPEGGDDDLADFRLEPWVRLLKLSAARSVPKKSSTLYSSGPPLVPNGCAPQAVGRSVNSSWSGCRDSFRIPNTAFAVAPTLSIFST